MFWVEDLRPRASEFPSCTLGLGSHFAFGFFKA